MHHLSKNMGKGEAARIGMLKAIVSNPLFIGYWDADFSTPLNEIFHLKKILIENRDLCLVTGVRSNLWGGRLFASHGVTIVEDSLPL